MGLNTKRIKVEQTKKTAEKCLSQQSLRVSHQRTYCFHMYRVTQTRKGDHTGRPKPSEHSTVPAQSARGGGVPTFKMSSLVLVLWH